MLRKFHVDEYVKIEFMKLKISNKYIQQGIVAPKSHQIKNKCFLAFKKADQMNTKGDKVHKIHYDHVSDISKSKLKAIVMNQPVLVRSFKYISSRLFPEDPLLSLS